MKPCEVVIYQRDDGHCFCDGDWSPGFEKSFVRCCRCGVTTYDLSGNTLRGPAGESWEEQ